MGLLKKTLGETVGRLLFRELRVTSAREVSPRFRRVDLESEKLRGAACGAGDKIQLMTTEGEMRTYLAARVDGARGAVSLLATCTVTRPPARSGEARRVGDRARAFDREARSR